MRKEKTGIKTRRQIEFGENEDRASKIQSYANLNTNGNFTKAVNKLVDEALKSTKNNFYQEK